MQSALRQAIARIDVVQSDASVARGTGCLIAPGLVLTAMHVVANRSESTAIAGTIVVTFPSHTTEATIVEGRWDPRSDWALLRCVTPPPGVGPVPLGEGALDGAEWETFGFPDANSRDGLAQQGTVEHAAGTFDGVAAYQLFSKQAAAGVGAPVRGLSGGPVIVEGALVGVFRSSLMRDGQFNVAGTLYACPIDAVLDRCADLLPIPDPCRGLPGLPRLALPKVPYRFLERFTARDAEIFFGRNREIREFYDRVTTDGGAPIVLLYGQSGAGKSSFLDAGLLPRLAASHATIYIRRDHEKGLLPTLVDAMLAALPGGLPATAPDQAVAAAWRSIETTTARPLVVILDQVEEVFTRPSAAASELGTLVEGLTALLAGPPLRGRLVLAFRKEWLGEIQNALDLQGLDYSKVFLEALNGRAAAEVVTGLTRTKRVREKYGLTVAEGLADKIAGDLTLDSDSPVAPTLQVLLSRMWLNATEASSGSPRFTLELYASVTRAGFLLTHFLNHQLEALAESAKAAGGPVADVAQSGLALDVLRFHVSRLGTAEERTRQALIDEYHRDDDVAWLVGELKRLYLLTEPGGDEAHTGATRLAHDTLAPAVRTRYDESVLPGQRARRVLEARAGEWSERDATPLDARDLDRVEQGASGMRAPRPHEERLIAASRLLRLQDEAKRRRFRYAAIAATVFVVIAAGAAWTFRQRNLADQAWNGLLALTESIAAVLDMEPALGLALAIDGLDRSADLKGEVVSASLQEGLALALVSARERLVWTLPATGTATAMSRDGRVAAAAAAGSIHLSSLDAPETVTVINAPAAAVKDLAFSDDGEFLAAALAQGGVALWRRDGQRVTGLPAELNGDAVAVRFVPGRRAFIAMMLGEFIEPPPHGEARAISLLLFDPESRQMATTLLQWGYGGATQPLAVAPLDNGRVVVAVATERRIVLNGIDGHRWFDERGEALATPRSPGSADEDLPWETKGIRAVSLVRDASHLWLAAAFTGRVVVVDMDGNRMSTVVLESTTPYRHVSFGAGARTLITGAADGLVRIYDRAGQPVLAPMPVANDITALAVSADGEFVAATGEGARPRLSVLDMVGLQIPVPEFWTPSDRAQAPRPTPPPRAIRAAIAFQPNGRLVVAGAGTYSGIWQFDLPRGRSTPATKVFAPLPPDAGSAVSVDSTGRFFTLAGGGVRMFSAEGVRLADLASTTGHVRSFALSPNGRRLITSSEKGRLEVVDVTSSTFVPLPSAPAANPDHADTGALAIAFAPDGDRIGSVFPDGHFRSYHSDGSEMGGDQPQPGAQASALVFRSQGELIVGSTRGEVQAQRIVDGKRLDWRIRAFAGGTIAGFAVHPSGSPLFVAGSQGLRALDLDSGSVLGVAMPYASTPLTGVAVSPDGRIVVGVREQGGLLFWRASWQEWLAEGCERLRRHELFTLMARPGLVVDTIPGLVGIEPYNVRNACNRLVPAAK